MHGLNLQDLDVFRVGDDVFFGGLVADARFEGDQPGLGQQLQAAPAVDRVVGDGHGGAFRQGIEAFVFFRIQAHVVDDAFGVGRQIKAGGGLGVFQEGDVLEVVHVDIAAGEADVWRDPVGELHQLDLEPLLVGLGHGGFQGDGESGGSANLERLVSRVEQTAKQPEGQHQCVFFVHGVFSVK